MYRYYKLKQVDFDESFDFSNVIEVGGEKNSQEGLSIFPNPVNDVVHIDAGRIPEGTYTMEIFESSGKRLERMPVTVANEDVPINLLVGSFENGLYFIVFSNGYGAKYHERFLKK